MNINEKLNQLKQLREHMDDDTFKYIAADIFTNYYLQFIQANEVSKSMKYVLKMVNRSLKSLGVSEVSYYYIRKRVEKVEEADKQASR